MPLLSRLEDFVDDPESIRWIQLSPNEAPLAMRFDESVWHDIARIRYADKHPGRLMEATLFIEASAMYANDERLKKAIQNLWLETELVFKIGNDLFNGYVEDFGVTHGVTKFVVADKMLIDPLHPPESYQKEFVPIHKGEIGDNIVIMLVLILKAFYRLPNTDKRWFEMQVDFGANKGKEYYDAGR